MDARIRLRMVDDLRKQAALIRDELKHYSREFTPSERRKLLKLATDCDYAIVMIDGATK